MWLRAFTILFELRARVSQNLKTTIDINNHLGIRPESTIDSKSSIVTLDNMQNYKRPSLKEK